VNNALPDLDSAILKEIAESSRRLTLPDIERRLIQRFRIGRRQIRRTIRRLLERNQLQFTYTFGSSFLEVSVNHPRFIPPRIWLAPSGTTPNLEDGQIAVLLQSGAAFGAGDHPSTRQALRGLQWTVHHVTAASGVISGKVLDIGTGSGVLLISALKLGFPKGTGMDTDPCARVEARQNLRLNGLDHCARIHGRALGSLQEKPALILANLRLPTIMELLPEMDRRMPPEAMAVFSGIHTAEEPVIVKRCATRSWACLWRCSEKDWSAVVFQKGNAMADGGSSESV